MTKHKNEAKEDPKKARKMTVPGQMAADLSECYKDCDIIADVLKRFQFTQPEKSFKLANPKYMELMTMNNKLKKRFETNPDKKYAVFYVFSGHGL